MAHQGNRISWEEIQPEVKSYFDLHQFKTISKSHLIVIICEHIKPKLNHMIRKIQSIYYRGCTVSTDEIENYIYSIILDIIHNWDNFKYLPFSVWFWKSVKINTLNYVNKNNNAQYSFEDGLHNNINLDKVSYNYHSANQQSNLCEVYNLNFLKKILNKEEIEFLTEMMNLPKRPRINKQSLKGKLICQINKKIKEFLEISNIE